MGKPKKFTEEQTRAYLKCDGTRCPHCGSTKVRTQMNAPPGFAAGIAWQPVYCGDCHKKWDEVYSLCAIEP